MQLLRTPRLSGTKPKPPLCKGRCRGTRRRDCKKPKNYVKIIPQSALLTGKLLYKAINILANASEVFMYFGIRYSDNRQPVLFKEKRSFFIIQLSFLCIMPGTIKLNNKICLCAIKIYDIFFQEPFDEKSERDKCAENHTKDVFRLWSYFSAAFLRLEQYLYCVFFALQSLRHSPQILNLLGSCHLPLHKGGLCKILHFSINWNFIK